MERRIPACPIATTPRSPLPRADAALLHDLNNSLAAIVAFSHLIRTDPSLPEGLRHHAAMLVEEADRTRQIVANLVGRSHVDGGSDGRRRGRSWRRPGQAQTRHRGPAAILVVDDEPAIRDFLARILRRSGYEVTLAVRGPSALEIVRNDLPTRSCATTAWSA